MGLGEAFIFGYGRHVDLAGFLKMLRNQPHDQICRMRGPAIGVPDWVMICMKHGYNLLGCFGLCPFPQIGVEL